jgi:hypothetical protein
MNATATDRKGATMRITKTLCLLALGLLISSGCSTARSHPSFDRKISSERNELTYLSVLTAEAWIAAVAKKDEKTASRLKPAALDALNEIDSYLHSFAESEKKKGDNSAKAASVEETRGRLQKVLAHWNENSLHALVKDEFKTVHAGKSLLSDRLSTFVQSEIHSGSN